jgi:cytochrome c oxidase assembly factor CtaG
MQAPDWSGIASVCFGGATVAGWTLNVAIVLPLGLVLGLYLAGLARLWRRAGIGRGTSVTQAGCFICGWLLAAGALMTPLHALSRELFTAHMIEHEVLMVLAAPLLVLSRPLGIMLWALPASWRGPVARGAHVIAYLFAWDVITRPLVATALHAAAIWLWHAPLLFEAALQNEALHWLQHFSFVATALLFWWAMFDRHARSGQGVPIFCLFATSLQTGFLGVLITFLPRPVFPLQSFAAAQWGLTPLSDQQLAGLIMWIPGGTAYAIAALALAARWINGASRGRTASSSASVESQRLV